LSSQLLVLALYLLTGAFWLPVVWMQARMRTLAADATAAGRPLPPAHPGSIAGGSTSAARPSPPVWGPSG
jgi:uncharacterized membrane protein